MQAHTIEQYSHLEDTVITVHANAFELECLFRHADLLKVSWTSHGGSILFDCGYNIVDGQTAGTMIDLSWHNVNAHLVLVWCTKGDFVNQRMAKDCIQTKYAQARQHLESRDFYMLLSDWRGV